MRSAGHTWDGDPIDYMPEVYLGFSFRDLACWPAFLMILLRRLKSRLLILEMNASRVEKFSLLTFDLPSFL